jgi:hypothetical protein
MWRVSSKGLQPIFNRLEARPENLGQGFGRARLRCTDRIDRLHLFGYIVYRCATPLVRVGEMSSGLVDDRCGQPVTTAQFKSQSGINGRLRLSRCARGAPPFIPFGSCTVPWLREEVAITFLEKSAFFTLRRRWLGRLGKNGAFCCPLEPFASQGAQSSSS